MTTKAPSIVRASDGRLGTIVAGHHDRSRELEAMVDILLEDGERLFVPKKILEEQSDGSYRLDLAAVEARSGVEVVANKARRAGSGEVVVPLVAETIEIGKQTVETGQVHVHKTVRATERVVDEPVMHEEVEVVRVPINRPIAEAAVPRQEGDTLIIPLMEEVLVVEKRLILREEMRITRRKVEKRSTQKISLRSEEATVERSSLEAGEKRSD